MWVYVQSTGDLFHNTQFIETGYSGAVPDGKNNPDKECVINVGPIPRGYYSIGKAVSKPTVVTLPLDADDPHYCSPPRDGFLIHGGNASGTASSGCIIMSLPTRKLVDASEDKRLRVVRDSVRKRRKKR